MACGYAQPRPQLQMNQLGEVTHEMILRGEVAGAETLDVTRIEGVKLQRFLRNVLGRKYNSGKADIEGGVCVSSDWSLGGHQTWLPH